MKMKTIYKIILILLIIGISTLICSINQSFADEHLEEPYGEQYTEDWDNFQIDPSEALGGYEDRVPGIRSYKNKPNLFCAEYGQTIAGYYMYKGKKIYYADCEWGCTAYVHASSKCGEVWHELGYVACNNTSQDLLSKHSSGDPHYEGQGAIWRICQAHNSELKTYFETFTKYKSYYGYCTCGEDLYDKAEDNWKGSNEGELYGFDVSIYIYECFDYGNDYKPFGVSQKIIYIVAKPYTQEGSNKLKFIKVDSDTGEPLDKATMKVSYSNSEIKKINGLGLLKKLKSNEKGELGKELTITPKDPNSTVTLTFTETDAPNGYKKFDGNKESVDLKITFVNGNITKVESSDYGFESYDAESHTVKLRDDSTTSEDKITLKLQKWDKVNNRSVAEALISVKKALTNSNIKNDSDIDPQSFTSEASYTTVKIKPEDFSKGEVKIIIKEDSAPDGYYKILTPMTLTVKYDPSTKKVTSVTGSTNIEYKGDGLVYILNTPTGTIIPSSGELQLHKYNVDNESESVQGAVFNISLRCTTSDSNTQVSPYSTSFSGTTDANGNIAFDLFTNDLRQIFNNAVDPTYNDDGTIKTEGKPAVNPINFEMIVTETDRPISPVRYKKLEGQMKIRLTIEKTALGALRITNATVDENFKAVKETGQSLNGKVSIESSGKTLKLEIPNKKDSVNIKLYKKDYLDTASVGSAHFSIDTDAATYKDPNGGTTDSSGLLEIKDISPAGNSGVYVILTEDSVPIGLEKVKPIKITWDSSLGQPTIQIQDDSGNWTSYTGASSWDASTATITLSDTTDENKVESFTFRKVDLVTGEGLENFIFNFAFEGIKSIGKVNGSELPKGATSVNDVMTDSKGEIVFEDIILASHDVKLTATEVAINPTYDKEQQDPKGDPYYYQKIETPIEFSIHYNSFGGGYKITTQVANGGAEAVQGNEKIYGKRKISDLAEGKDDVAIVKDIPLMDIEGQVWQDQEIGYKEIQEADGMKNDKYYIPGVEIRLYEKTGSVDYSKNILKGKGGAGLEEAERLTSGEKPNPGNDVQSHKNKFTTTNEEDGKYKIEAVVCPRRDSSSRAESEYKNFEGYVVQFAYNGIEFNDTLSGDGRDSRASEKQNNRNAFNDRFSTIGYNKSNSTSLVYDNTTNPMIDGNVQYSDLRDDISGKNPEGGETDFEMTAETPEDDVIETTDHAVDYGMIKRFFDLKLDMVIHSTRLMINNKSTVYDYETEIARLYGDSAYTHDEDKTGTEGDYERLTDRDKHTYLGNHQIEMEWNNKDRGDYIDLKLYDSDYRYRVEDYSKDIVNFLGEQEDRKETGDTYNDRFVGSEGANGADALKTLSEKGITQGDINNVFDKTTQLRAYVTYEVAIMNQSYVEDAQVNKLKYYYDTGYNVVKELNAQGEEVGPVLTASTQLKDGVADPDHVVEFVETGATTTINGKEYKIGEVNLGSSATKLNEQNDYRQVIYLTFEITRDKNSSGIKDGLPQQISESDGMKFANIVEIAEYQTSGGYIDEDSNPDNLVNDSQIKSESDVWEDDTYGAKSIRVTIINDRRSIEGYVWDDENKNGVFDSDEKPIDGVVVQLIELRNIPAAGSNEKYYREAIWQQTRSGSNEVTSRSIFTGVADQKYSHDEAMEKGKYKFTGFIPGDYIVRFIYGDGLYSLFYLDGTNGGKLTKIEDGKDVIPGITEEMKENIKKYNGQDYQSTIDARKANGQDYQYDKQYYLAKTPLDDNGNISYTTAWDNEPRRLQVISYSTIMDGKIGETLNIVNKKIEDILNKEQKMQLSSNELNQYSRERRLIVEYMQGVKDKVYLAKTLSDDAYTLSDTDGFAEVFEAAQNYALENTWMCSETGIMPFNVSEEDKKVADEDGLTIVPSVKPEVIYEDKRIEFYDVDLGIMLRPETRLEYEKHITALKIVPMGTGIDPIVDARAQICTTKKAGESEIGILNVKENENGSKVGTTGINSKLGTIRSTRTGEGFWKLETDIEELTQSANLSVEYTYVIRNESDDAYLSKKLMTEYVDNINTDKYSSKLNENAKEVRNHIKHAKYKEKLVNEEEYLGKWYFTGEIGTNDTDVLSRVETLNDYINNGLTFESSPTKEAYSGNGFYAKKFDVDADGIETIKTKLKNRNKIIYTNPVQPTAITEEINSIIQNNIGNDEGIDTTTGEYQRFLFLKRIEKDENGEYKNDRYTRYVCNPYDKSDKNAVKDLNKMGNTDYTKVVRLTKILDIDEMKKEEGITIPSYLSEISAISNAAGRRNMEATTENLEYVYSKSDSMTLDTYVNQVDVDANNNPVVDFSLNPTDEKSVRLNENDEYWGEKIIITKPTGEDKQFPIVAVAVITSSVALIGVGVFLIKKFVLVKNK